jgi:hypothetical protein
MGNTAAFGLNLDINVDIYMSYNEENDLCKELKTKLEVLDFKIIDSSFLINTINESRLREKDAIYKNLGQIVNKMKYIFICLTPTTVYSLTQSIEYDKLVVDNAKINIIYLMMDEYYTPESSNEPITIIKNNKWFPLYDVYTLEETYNKLITLLLNQSP